MRTKRTTVAAAMALIAGFAADRAAAGSLEELTARIDALEKQNAAIRKENAVLRENKQLIAQNARLKSQLSAGARAPLSPRAEAAASAVVAPAPRQGNPFDAYAADPLVRALPQGVPGQFRAWVEGGAIWSGGDPIFDSYGGNIGVFDVTPKVGWEAAIGFDHRFANSPWHISGQFRYGEGKANGADATSQTLPFLGGTGVFAVTYGAAYKETHWLADIAVGRDIVSAGPATLQLKGGLRIAELTSKNNTSEVTSISLSGAAPPVVIAGFPPVTSFSTSTSNLFETRASFLGVGPMVGIEGAVPFAGRWSFDYLGDAAMLFGRQQQTQTASQLFSFTPSFLQPAGTTNTILTGTDRQFAGVLSADVQVGISYWLTQNLKLGVSYRLDTLINVFNESGKSNNNFTPDRYTHGPRVTLTGQFDAL